MRLPKDLREFIESLNSHHVEFVIVGGYALAFHGVPRYTGDIDILVRPTPENAAQLIGAIREFGFGSTGLTDADFLVPGQVIQLGYPPNQIDLLTAITGVGIDEIWEHRVAGQLDGVAVHFIGRESFIKNKAATGRTKDKADLETLALQ
jgi:predicted nucleotidyltransferase